MTHRVSGGIYGRSTGYVAAGLLGGWAQDNLSGDHRQPRAEPVGELSGQQVHHHHSAVIGTNIRPAADGEAPR
ncbi:MAG: hypothetical protein ACRDRA_00405 [Pseudonocardiaceae bacterium]